MKNEKEVVTIPIQFPLDRLEQYRECAEFAHQSVSEYLSRMFVDHAMEYENQTEWVRNAARYLNPNMEITFELPVTLNLDIWLKLATAAQSMGRDMETALYVLTEKLTDSGAIGETIVNWEKNDWKGGAR